MQINPEQVRAGRYGLAEGGGRAVTRAVAYNCCGDGGGSGGGGLLWWAMSVCM